MGTVTTSERKVLTNNSALDRPEQQAVVEQFVATIAAAAHDDEVRSRT
jgi:hypothetical protein